jgi:hypothetical protein
MMTRQNIRWRKVDQCGPILLDSVAANTGANSRWSHLYQDILDLYEVVCSAVNLQHRRVESPSVTTILGL